MCVNEFVEFELLDVSANPDDMPTEPGLYWAQTSLVDEFDSIVEVYGKSPWLRYQVIRMRSIGMRGKQIRSGLRIGPRIERQCLKGIESESTGLQ